MLHSQKQYNTSMCANKYVDDSQYCLQEQMGSTQFGSQSQLSKQLNKKIAKFNQQQAISFNQLLYLKCLIENAAGQEKNNKINSKINKFLAAYVFSDILGKIIKNNYKRSMGDKAELQSANEKAQKNKQKLSQKEISKNRELTKITQKDEDSQSVEQNKANSLNFEVDQKYSKLNTVAPSKVVKIAIWNQRLATAMFDKNAQQMNRKLNIITDFQQLPYDYSFKQQKMPKLVTPLNKQQFPIPQKIDISSVMIPTLALTQNVKQLSIIISEDQPISLKKSQSIGPNNKQVKQRIHAVRKTRSPLQKQRKSINFGNQALQFKNSLIKQRQSWKQKINLQNQILDIKDWPNQVYNRRIVKLRNKKNQYRYQPQQYLYCASQQKNAQNKYNNNESVSLQVKKIVSTKQKLITLPQNQNIFIKGTLIDFNQHIKQSNASTNIKSDQHTEYYIQKKQPQHQIVTNKFTRHKSQSLSLTSPKNIQNMAKKNGMRQISVCNSPHAFQSKVQLLRNKKRKSLGGQEKCNQNFDCLQNFTNANLNLEQKSIYKTVVSFSRPYKWKNSLISMREEEVSLSSSFESKKFNYI